MSSNLHLRVVWSFHPSHPHEPSHLRVPLLWKPAHQPWDLSHRTHGGTSQRSTFWSCPPWGSTVSVQGLRGQGAGSRASDRGVIWVAYEQLQGHYLPLNLRATEERARRREGVAEPGKPKAGEKAKNARPQDAISVEKYDFPLVQLSILLKENDSVLKMMNERGRKDGENEWIDKLVNPLNHCTCTVFFHSGFQVISWGYH